MLSILFVEDDATIAMGVEYSLKQDGFQISLAHRLEEARDLFKRQPFDLVLLDLGLPDGSGYELCKEIRAAGDTPIIILSARDEESSIVLGLDLGGFGIGLSALVAWAAILWGLYLMRTRRQKKPAAVSDAVTITPNRNPSVMTAHSRR